MIERWLARLDRVRGLGGGRSQMVFLALFFAVCYSCYLTVLKLRGPSVVLTTWVAWDELFAFTPWWIWLYLPVFVLGPLLTLLLSRYVFVWYVRRATVVLLVSIVIFVAVPSHTIRPLSIPSNRDRLGDNLTSWMYQRVVEIDDPPANAAPSLHVSLSCLLAWAMGYNYPRWWGAAFAGALLVWLSTLYTWQHHLIDVATGALLACLAAIGPPRPPPPVPDAGAP